MITQLSQRVLTRATVALAAVAATALATGAAAASGATTSAAAPSFSFALKLSSPAIAACMPHAGGRVTITRNAQNDVMKISLHGMAPNTVFATFVLQEPRKPFGLAWYQTDVNTDGRGNGNATVQGIFNRETFSLSVGGPTATFAPIHLFHLGLWFDDVDLPFELGCEPAATTPVITPFDGDHSAGPQALNTAQFPVNAGPLSRVPD
jgi:hypothetical protein